MSRPRSADIKRIESDTYKLGYARPVRGSWVIYISKHKFQTGIKAGWKNGSALNEALVKQEIDKRVQAYLQGWRPSKDTATTPESVQASGMTLYKMVDLWYQEFIESDPDLKEGSKKTAHYAIAEYCPEGQDMAVDTSRECITALATRFTRMKNESECSDSTLLIRLGVWKRIFSWGVSMGWLASNPMDIVRLPMRKRRPEDLRQWTKWELLRLLALARRQDKQMFRLLRFLHLTGMRIAEALQMRCRDVKADHLVIHGKSVKGVEHRIRYFPLLEFANGSRHADWINEIRNVLSEQMQGKSADSKIWQGDASYLRKLLRGYRKEAGMEGDDGRGFHTFRAMAEHEMQYTLGLPLWLVAKMLGHSIQVAEADYMYTPTPEKFAEILGYVVDNIQNSGKIPSAKSLLIGSKS